MTDGVRVVVVTGLSGAGKSTALHALEDLGYFCVDNLPPALLENAVQVCEAGGVRRIALGIDVRVGSFLDGAVEALDRIECHDGAASGPKPQAPSGPIYDGTASVAQSVKRDVKVLFLDATDEALLRRFSETRRPHPLTSAARERMRAASPADWSSSAFADVGAVAVLDGIQLERERLSRLRARASLVIDTTLLSVHELRGQVIAHLGPGKAEQPRMVTRIISFGFKYGVPVDADLVFDVRLLENPFFVPELRHLPGTDPAVQAFVLGNPETKEFLRRTDDLLAFSLPRYEREGKSYLTIAVGCTGGRHRSVALAGALGESLRAETGLPILVLHRDVGRADILATRPPKAPPLGKMDGGESK
jgi:RNase adapter protein RapZ